MKTIRDLLLDADPLRHEPTWPSGQRDFQRRAILAAAPSVRQAPLPRSRPTALVTLAFMVAVALFAGSRMWPLLVGDLKAAVRVEIRLAEDRQAFGLQQAKVSDSGQSVYLHTDVIVTNSDIAAAQVVQSGSSSLYGVGIKFNASGAEKMRVATKNHLGRPLAFLIDGQVVVAPILRTPIGTSAVITGKYTKTQAERIALGIKN